MPLLGFQSRFADLVERGEKRQTIRAYRKDGRDPKAGDRLYLWTGLRQPGARKLGEATCQSATPFEIVVTHLGGVYWCLGDDVMTQPEMEALARADGFESWSEMTLWFEKNHGFPFDGLLIEWGEIER